MADFDLVARPEKIIVVPEAFDFDKHWPVPAGTLAKGDRLRVQVSVRRDRVNTQIVDDVIVIRDYPDSKGLDMVGRVALFLATTPKEPVVPEPKE